MRMLRATYHVLAVLVLTASGRADGLTLTWQDNYLTVHGDELPGGKLTIHYLEAYCRANSHTTNWVEHTVISHQTTLVSASEDGRNVQLRCRLADGVIVDHQITASHDEIDFRIIARNPTDQASDVHWAQPCIRVGEFTGCGADRTRDAYAYVGKCFVFLDGQLQRLPTADWATEARYTPGQVWAGPGVPREDVNPRPLNPQTPRPGLIGCYRDDDRKVLAVAFQPYQELFQGVIRCLHSDFRIGGLPAGEQRVVRGKLYLVEPDIPALLSRYRKDFEKE